MSSLRHLPLPALVLCMSSVAAAPVRISSPHELSPHVSEGSRFMGIRLLGSVKLERREIDGVLLTGLSDLAWDPQAQVLYAVSDRGALFHLRPQIDDGRLRAVDALAAHPLRDERGRRLRARRADAEGLVRTTNAAGESAGRLAVSFEQIPRIIEFSAAGEPLASRALPAPLSDAARYASTNTALEAIAWRPRSGFLVAPERPLRGEPSDRVPIYDLRGRHWDYPLYPTPNSSLVAMEALPDGSLLTLERGYSPLLFPLVIVIRRTAVLPADSGTGLEVQTLAVLDSSNGWRVDNFEGLSRHEGMRFFMVSDDNNKAFQRTLLVYFEVLEGLDPADLADIPKFETVDKDGR